ncbi:malonate decarboxylase holo-ACP synthase [Paraburkholderia saeva]|uniref:Phosphoribosyl-dephospho-CoA transferase n=1 Tax=Paraburkholderia saeva TaxID=2777537 RepID=A0A9N8S258_9BURK|nr:malonate decarboxylase holo-ACP synthase [Paraburkholderia saeva]CAG4908611.1 Phosphoribosyl-dephospho-CoA transferase [Paraburkholderia saeva]CAG4913250.1 Phosphoribosyl-dephospho-CoA transferase [Paraburkholderia saeva]CAG4927104.1 Phosphoribosyl-dephospho-CoA transferase [Paraburkholderia saeva]
MRVRPVPPVSDLHVDEPEQAVCSGSRHWRTHDLLKLCRLSHFDTEPVWVREAFQRAPFGVVRRAQVAAGFIAIGIRGSTRAERYGAWARDADIEAVFAPEDLVDVTPLPERRALPAFAALEALRRDAAILNAFIWGPAGSTGFELATHAGTVTSSSDLDLLIRAPERMSRENALALLKELSRHAARDGVRIDAQLETPAGGIALAELAAGKERVMARHAHGPRLVTDAWSATTGFA